VAEQAENAEHAEGRDDPTIAAILADARAQISTGEQRHDRHRSEYDRENHEGRVRKQRSRSTPTEDCQSEISRAADRDEDQSGDE